jgi:hypothetical protein
MVLLIPHWARGERRGRSDCRWSPRSPFLFGSGFDVHGITLIVSGIVFVVALARMINQMLDGEMEQTGGTAGS